MGNLGVCVVSPKIFAYYAYEYNRICRGTLEQFPATWIGGFQSQKNLYRKFRCASATTSATLCALRASGPRFASWSVPHRGLFVFIIFITAGGKK